MVLRKMYTIRNAPIQRIYPPSIYLVDGVIRNGRNIIVIITIMIIIMNR